MSRREYVTTDPYGRSIRRTGTADDSPQALFPGTDVLEQRMPRPFHLVQPFPYIYEEMNPSILEAP